VANAVSSLPPSVSTIRSCAGPIPPACDTADGAEGSGSDVRSLRESAGDIALESADDEAKRDGTGDGETTRDSFVHAVVGGRVGQGGREYGVSHSVEELVRTDAAELWMPTEWRRDD